MIFHDKIQQSSINFTRFSFGKRSNRSAKKIIIVSIVLSHRDKQAIQHTSKQEPSEKEADGKRGRLNGKGEVGERKTRGKWQIM